ncbi:MAG: glutathione S-transferase family protein [Gemmatimonadota bacterium]
MRLYDYPASGNCYKVRLLLALLDRPYERVETDIFAGDTLTAEYRKLNPLRETPVLELDTGEVITQSNAILWYLAEGTPFLPDSSIDRAHVVQWLFFEQERVMSGIGSARFRIMTGRDPEVAAARFAIGEGALAVLEEHLAGRSFLVGEECSIADISNFAYTHVAEDAGYEIREYPAVYEWLGRVRALPRFIADLEPYPENARPGAGQSIYG